MYKKSVFFFSVASFSSLLGLYNGAPSLPEMPENPIFLQENCPISLKTDYEGDWVLGRSIKAHGLSDLRIHSRFQGAEITVGFIDRVDLYAVVGGFQETVHAESGDSSITYSIGGSFGGLAGVRAIAVFWGDIKLGVDAKYFYGWPHFTSIRSDSEKTSPGSEGFQREWQVGVSLGQKFAFFTPYVGLSYSRFVLHFSEKKGFSPGKITIENTSPFGACIGIGISGRKGIFADFEAGFFSEYRLTGSLGIRF